MSKQCVKCGYLRQASDNAPDYECPKCGVVYSKVEASAAAAQAKTNAESAAVTTSSAQDAVGRIAVSLALSETLLSDSTKKFSNTRLLLGLIGSITLFIGVFAPIVSMPIVGSINYFQNGKGDGVIVLIFALISFVIVLTKKYTWLWLTGLGSIGAMLFTFVRFQSKISELKSNMNSQLAGNPFRGFADAAINSIQLQWGWALLIVGAGFLIASAALKDKSS